MSLSPPVRSVAFELNGEPRQLQVDADDFLADVLRDELQLKGTRLGCGSEACGACHVLLDGRSVPSCTLPMWAVDGHAVCTVEGLDEAVHAAFEAEQAAQCGYCSSGMQVAVAALLRLNPAPTEDEVRRALDRHLCRCGAHNGIVRAALRAAAALAAERGVAPAA